MPWKERSVVEERMRFVLRLRDGESMASLCREFGISRVTGYKIYDRYKECGLEGLTDRARTPYRYANKLPAQLEAMIVSMRREKPTWGARKLRDRLLRKLPNDVRVPACSTIHAILDRHGLVVRPRHSRTKSEGTPLSPGLTPNALWCTDYKGEFLLGDKRYCYPLTVSDHASRYLLLCEAMESVKEQAAFTAFERLFKERGLPHAIRSDNGVVYGGDAKPVAHGENQIDAANQGQHWHDADGECVDAEPSPGRQRGKQQQTKTVAEVKPNPGSPHVRASTRQSERRIGHCLCN